jgi:formate hydrogenlyase subunit 4
MNPLIMTLLRALCNVALAVALAPLFEGVVRKITAIVQSRKGPPLLQPYMDLAKLLVKEDIEVGHSPVMQRFSALLSIGALLTVALFIPITGRAPFAAGGDSIQMIYLLSLAGIAVLLAALSAGSTYSLIGMSREMMGMMTLEPLFAVAVVMAAVKGGSLRLDAVFGGAIYGEGLGIISGLCMLGIMLFAFQAFVGRAPFDVTEAETEIMEGPLIEYSGPKLALFKYGYMIKLFVYAGLFTAIFVPRIGGPGILGFVVFLSCQCALVLLATLVAATHARYRIDQVIRYYVLLFAVAVICLAVSLFGW